MDKQSIVLAGFQIPSEGWDLLSKIVNVLVKLLRDEGHPEIFVVTNDLASNSVLEEEIEESYFYAFGEVASRLIEGTENIVLLPSIQTILNDVNARKSAGDIIKNSIPNVVEHLNKKKKEKEEKIECHVETKEGLSIGPVGCDFCISEREANHLKKIIDILGAGKIVITKGDLRIEVEK